MNVLYLCSALFLIQTSSKYTSYLHTYHVQQSRQIQCLSQMYHNLYDLFTDLLLTTVELMKIFIQYKPYCMKSGQIILQLAS